MKTELGKLKVEDLTRQNIAEVLAKTLKVKTKPRVIECKDKSYFKINKDNYLLKVEVRDTPDDKPSMKRTHIVATLEYCIKGTRSTKQHMYVIDKYLVTNIYSGKVNLTTTVKGKPVVSNNLESVADTIAYKFSYNMESFSSKKERYIPPYSYANASDLNSDILDHYEDYKLIVSLADKASSIIKLCNTKPNSHVSSTIRYFNGTITYTNTFFGDNVRKGIADIEVALPKSNKELTFKVSVKKENSKATLPKTIKVNIEDIVKDGMNVIDKQYDVIHKISEYIIKRI